MKDINKTKDFYATYYCDKEGNITYAMSSKQTTKEEFIERLKNNGCIPIKNTTKIQTVFVFLNSNHELYGNPFGKAPEKLWEIINTEQDILNFKYQVEVERKKLEDDKEKMIWNNAINNLS